ncbi:MAG: hypothetical protein MZV64_12520 [Ignavibacteriales bacterium]|nr:hypothetical protein [Ignavibacteriales bacterium]
MIGNGDLVNEHQGEADHLRRDDDRREPDHRHRHLPDPGHGRRRGQDAGALLRGLGPRGPDQLHRRPDLRRDRRPLRQAGQLLQGRGRELRLRPGLHAQLDQRRHPQRGRGGRRRPDRRRIPDAHRLPGRRPDDGDRPGHRRHPHPRAPGHQLSRHQDRRLGPERPEHPQGGHDRPAGRGRVPVQEGPRRPGRPAARPALVPGARRRLHLRLLRLRRLPEHHQLRRRRPRRPAQRPPGRLLRHPHRPGLLPDHQRRLRQGPRCPRHRRGQARRGRNGPGHPGRDGQAGRLAGHLPLGHGLPQRHPDADPPGLLFHGRGPDPAGGLPEGQSEDPDPGVRAPLPRRHHPRLDLPPAEIREHRQLRHVPRHDHPGRRFVLRLLPAAQGPALRRGLHGLPHPPVPRPAARLHRDHAGRGRERPGHPDPRGPLRDGLLRRRLPRLPADAAGQPAPAGRAAGRGLTGSRDM